MKLPSRNIAKGWRPGAFLSRSFYLPRQSFTLVAQL